MRACAPQGASCCIFYLGNAFFETFPKIVFFQNLGGGFLPSQRAVPLRTRESNQGRLTNVGTYCKYFVKASPRPASGEWATQNTPPNAAMGRTVKPA